MVTFLAKRLFDTTKTAQAGNAGIPFKKVLDEAKFLSLPRAKVGAGLGAGVRVGVGIGIGAEVGVGVAVESGVRVGVGVRFRG